MPKPSARFSLAAFVLLLMLSLGLVQRHQIHHARLNRALIHAVQDGNALAVQRLLNQGADPNTRQEGESPPSIWQSLLASFRNLWHRHRTPPPLLPPTALVMAATEGNPQIVKALLDKGADINAKSENLWDAGVIHQNATALSEATMNHPSKTVLIKLLLDRGANTNMQNDHTPLGWVCNDLPIYKNNILHKNNDLHVINLLLDHGADINARDSDGSSALSIVTSDNIAHNDNDIAAIKILLSRGVNVNDRDSDGSTALMRMIGNPALCKFLIEHGADVNTKDNDGKTPLMSAAPYADAPSLVTAKILLNNGADANAKDNEGGTALMCAVHDDAAQIPMIKLLLSHDARVNDRDMHRYTAMEIAIAIGNWKAVALLRKAGARE